MFQDTLPDGLHPPAADPALSTLRRRTGSAAVVPHRLDIRFTGSGSEYFRIWIVNLLLTVVTLGIYYPWAKVRRLKYFHGNTVVDGEPLGFHGNPRKMLRGYLLVAAMFGLYSVAGRFSPVAGLVALAIVSAVGPALLRASLRFRLANTSWRGLHMRFTGSLREVYVLLWPSLALFGFVVLTTLLAAPGPQPSGAAAWLPLLVLLLVYPAMIWMFWRLRKYQHDHYGWASLQTRFDVRARSFFGLALRTVGVFLLSMVAVAVPVLVLAFAFGGAGAGRGAQGALYLSLLPLVLMFAILAVLKPYLTTRMQNLVWNGTGGTGLQFASALGFRPMLWMTLRNWLLIVVTLGLYWPFAAVAMARLRLQAVSLALQEDPAALAGRVHEGAEDAAGDAAGDLFGIDFGL